MITNPSSNERTIGERNPIETQFKCCFTADMYSSTMCLESLHHCQLGREWLMKPLQGPSMATDRSSTSKDVRDQASTDPRYTGQNAMHECVAFQTISLESMSWPIPVSRLEWERPRMTETATLGRPRSAPRKIGGDQTRSNLQFPSIRIQGFPIACLHTPGFPHSQCMDLPALLLPDGSWLCTLPAFPPPPTMVRMLLCTYLAKYT
ncbi:uncharacterized protein LY79DRAFT_563028 [Colletotrichum navitas]|uniref:Uncharacterized protein n=1 Tax=Colletotrichum navitas TaxID=681940 RepID=A0AAD8PSC1_9PEZI|nr:uncharacterized protein LY79DRAFT_563028 [Colletotrichum navitas]KAK1579829.1 hypothetical protein LY79DRAFT_563028 [Colletotrichum navitas]